MKYGLIGEHLPHSFSKTIHEYIGNRDYELCEVARDELDEFMKRRDFKGINVTIPYKQTVIPYLHEISERAKCIGAVNTIVNKDGKLYGDNTDFGGLSALIRKLKIRPEGKKALILGTGGTSNTAHAVLKTMGAETLYKVSRSEKDGSITYDEMYEEHTDAEIIINTTPCGMYPKPCEKPVDLAKFPKLEAVVDVIYNPLETILVIQAKSLGVKAQGGLYMLVAQAALSEEQFTGIKADKELLDSIYERILDEKRNIVLTGLPSSGKTTAGRRLSELTGRPFFDSDEEIEKQEGMSIPQIFEKCGEGGFREKEARVIAELSRKNGVIIATGGGSVLRQENVEALKTNGIIVFLDRNPETLVPTDDRPLFDKKDKINELYISRYPIYSMAADISIKADGGYAEAGDAIYKLIFKGAKKMKILVINGPNLNMLGIREPDIYGSDTYEALCQKIRDHAKSRNIDVELYQSNHEGALVDKIQAAYDDADGIVINAGAYTHTSIALLDAVKAVGIPTVEVHISDVASRENFRQVSYIRMACVKTIAGHGFDGYLEAMDLLIERDKKG